MGPRRVILLLTTAVFLSGGCHALKMGPKSKYETLTVDPRHNTKEARVKSERAVELMEKGHLDKAAKLLQDALVADVTYAPAHNNLGSLYLQRGEYYLAAWEFEYAIKLMRDRPEPYNNLGMVYEAVGRYEDAVRNYELACRSDPRSAEYLGNLARAQVRRGDPPDMVRPLLEQLIFLDTRHDWVGWAREYIALHNPTDTPALTDPSGNPGRSTLPEIVPPPAGPPPTAEQLPPPKPPSTTSILNAKPTASPRQESPSESARIARQHVGPTAKSGGALVPSKNRGLPPLHLPSSRPEE